MSWYYWNFRTEPRPSISEFIQSRDFNVIKGFELYTRSADILVDKVFFYENLSQSLEEIRDRVGLNETPSLPVTKGNYREDTRNYRDILSEKDKERISKAYAREIAYFDYEW